MTAQQIISLIVSWLTQAVSIALLVLIACAVAGFFGLRAGWLPKISEQPLAIICGAFWLWRGGRLG